VGADDYEILVRIANNFRVLKRAQDEEKELDGRKKKGKHPSSQEGKKGLEWTT